MKYLYKFEALKHSPKTYTWQQLKDLVSRFDSLEIFKEEEPDVYRYMLAKKIVYDFFPEELEKVLTKIKTLDELKSYPLLYDKALKAGLLTKFFPDEVSMPVKQTTGNLSKIYNTLDSLEKNLDMILSRYKR